MTLQTACLLLTMAGVTYLIRMLPLTLFRKKIKSPFVKNFLYYIPFTVLGAMTFPYILFSVGSGATAADLIAAGMGTVAAMITAFCRRSLIVVALVGCITALAALLVLRYLPV